MRTTKYLVWIMVLVIVTACKKPFNPILASTATGFLSVDGPILSGDSTIITLSRTTALSDTTQQKMELKAVVSVEDDQGKLYALTELGKGKYALGVTTFNSARQYRLDIKTSVGKVYQSDLVPMKTTPPIDSIYFQQNSDAMVLFYVNAHDPTGNTRYYRWDYKETWSYVALYPSFYHYSNGQIVSTTPDGPDDVFVCYRGGASNQIFIGSSAKLSEDIIQAQLLDGLSNGSQKLGHVYVMQLRQYALTQAGYNYYQNLKANTENLGSIFDAQPSTMLGNIHCITTPTEMVLGFVSASTVTAKQFNLHYNDIPLRTPGAYGSLFWLNEPATSTTRPYSDYYFPPPDTFACHYNKIKGPSSLPFVLSPVQNLIFLKGDSVVFDRALAVINGPYYYYAPKTCVDCRTKGGTNIRPPYFPYPAY